MKRFKMRLTFSLVVAVAAMALAAAPARADDATIAEAHKTVEVFMKTDPTIARFFERSVGYVVFPGVAKGGFGVGGAHGTGILFDHGKAVGKASLTQVTVGAQVGGQTYSEIIFFETPAALAKFKSGNFAFSAQVSAVALQSGAAASAKYQDGVALFTATKGGMMAEASVGGQKFKFEPFPTPM